jgi:hypothetical protein
MIFISLFSIYFLFLLVHFIIAGLQPSSSNEKTSMTLVFIQIIRNRNNISNLIIYQMEAKKYKKHK